MNTEHAALAAHLNALDAAREACADVCDEAERNAVARMKTATSDRDAVRWRLRADAARGLATALRTGGAAPWGDDNLTSNATA